MTVLINAANVLSVLGYFTTDMLRLRLLSLVATTCGLIYFYSQPEPLMTVVAWNLVFLGLNAVQLVRLLRPRWPRGAAHPGAAVA
mgnify:CR=1 FL=1